MKITLKKKRSASEDVNAAPKNTLPRDERYANAIAPGAVYFEPDHIEIDGTYRKVFGLREFSTLNKAGWGEALFSRPGMLATITVKPSDGETIKRSINHTDARAGVSLLQGGSATKSMDAQLDRDHARTMIEYMADAKKTFVNCSFLFQMDCANADDLAVEYKALSDTAKPKGMTLDPAMRAQERGLRWASPLCSTDDKYLAPRFSIDMPVDTLAACLPFSTTGLIDEDGTNLGVDAAHSLVRVNMLKTSMYRGNMNSIIFGPSGSGKSRTLKKIVLDEYAKAGARIIWIDPEGEAKFTCKKLYGQYINAGGSGGAMLCPLQPRMVNYSLDDEDDEEADVLRSTINFLRGFYQLAFGITTRELPYLDKGLVEAYRRHGLTYDTPAEEIDFYDYPSMDEVAGVFHEFAASAKREDVQRVYEYLAEQTATGGEKGLFGNLWSGKTNVDLNSDFIVFDIHALTSGNMSAPVKNAQMYSILTFVWSEICRGVVDRKPTRLVIDEGHMLFGTQTDTGEHRGCPISAAFVAMIAKRARKRNAGLLFCTQEISDLTHESVAQYGQALVSNSTYQFVFGAKSTSDLVEIQKLFGLSDELTARVQGFKKRGQCILKAGEDMTYLEVEDTAAEHAWIGTSGGK